MTAPLGFTDFHSHLFPGVDDGAQTPEDSAAALAAFRKDGTRQLITTPHFMGSLTRNRAMLADRLDQLEAGWARLRAVVARDAERHGSPMRVERGVEVMLDVPDPDLSDPRLRLAGTNFALVEYPSLRLPPMNAEFAVIALCEQGWTPVVAHPERYRNLAEYETLARFKGAGAYLQINAGSLFGDHGKTAATHAMNIITLGLADYVASDYHARGLPRLRDFHHAVVEAGYPEQAELLGVTNPARLLEGLPPLPVPPFVVADAEPAT
ncbi:MAG: CpsB/CapC family capsule biosynthesis tyrosine phosphatase [bacterium]